MARVVAPSGFLCGHDFGHPKKKDASPGMEYGVIEATVDFALEQGWELVAVSLRDAPPRLGGAQRSLCRPLPTDYLTGGTNRVRALDARGADCGAGP